MPYPEPTVSAIIFNPDDEVLLCRSHKWEDKYVIPGGHVEIGEPMEEALRREVREETGLEIYDITLRGIKESIFSDRYHEQRHFIFLDFTCRTDSKEVTLNDESEEYAWVPLDKIHDYPLGGFVEPLLTRINSPDDAADQEIIYYNY